MQGLGKQICQVSPGAIAVFATDVKEYYLSYRF